MLNKSIKPMLLSQTDTISNKPDQIYEIKLDGWRCILKLNSSEEITLQSRHGNIATGNYPEIIKAAKEHLKCKEVILDGEMVCSDPDTGLPDFEMAMARYMMTNKTKLQYHVISHPATFFAFDILYRDGKNLMSLPLIERKEHLQQVIDDNPFIKIVDFFPDQGEKLHKLSIQYGLEGIVEKKPDSRYILNHRTSQWRKLVNYNYTDCFISGYRKEKMGLYLVDSTNLKPLGICEFVPQKEIKALYNIAHLIKSGEDKEKIFLEPKIKCRIKHRGLTSKGYLRIPVLTEFIA